MDNINSSIIKPTVAVVWLTAVAWIVNNGFESISDRFGLNFVILLFISTAWIFLLDWVEEEFWPKLPIAIRKGVGGVIVLVGSVLLLIFAMEFFLFSLPVLLIIAVIASREN